MPVCDTLPSDGRFHFGGCMDRILIVDDEPGIRSAIRMILEYEGYQVIEAEDGSKALETARKRRPDLVLLDFKMEGLDGMDILQKLKQDYPDLPVIMLSGHGSITTAVQATKYGAFDFLEKPPQRDRIVLTIRNALEYARLKTKASSIDTRHETIMIGRSSALEEVIEIINKVAHSELSVLIRGESGTGKELAAEDIHRRSRRAGNPFVQVNCAAIPEDLIESELFGHEKGSFTGATERLRGKFELAHNGTLFLDEIGDMSLRTQAKVLRAIQLGEFQRVGGAQTLHADVRIISATNQDLEEMIAEGTFREDLFYRINVIPIVLPPLRERIDDLEDLVTYFASRFIRLNNLIDLKFSSDAIEYLKLLPWTGNIRELKNVIERNLILSQGPVIGVNDIKADLERFSSERPLRCNPSSDSLSSFKDESERQYLLSKLDENHWNIKATALAIGTPRSNLYKRMQHLKIERKR